MCVTAQSGVLWWRIKTDCIRPGEELQRAEEYRAQLWAYSEALSRVLEEPVCRRVLYFFATGAEVEL